MFMEIDIQMTNFTLGIILFEEQYIFLTNY